MLCKRLSRSPLNACRRIKFPDDLQSEILRVEHTLPLYYISNERKGELRFNFVICRKLRSRDHEENFTANSLAFSSLTRGINRNSFALDR